MRPHPLDAALFAVAVLAAVYLLVTVPGYRWRGQPGGGYLRVVPMHLTLEVAGTTECRVAAGLAPGRRMAETGRGPAEIEVLNVDSGHETVRVELRVSGEEDGQGRRFWNDQRLRRGEGFGFADAAVRVRGVLIAAEPVATSPP